jgi:hypothetical protein
VFGENLYNSTMDFHFLGETHNSSVSSVKDKAIPLQVWTGLEGSRRLRFPNFKTIGT